MIIPSHHPDSQPSSEKTENAPDKLLSYLRFVSKNKSLDKEGLLDYIDIGVDVCSDSSDIKTFLICCTYLDSELPHLHVRELGQRYGDCLHFVVETLFPDNLHKEEKLRPAFLEIIDIIRGRSNYVEPVDDSQAMCWLLDKHSEKAVELFQRYGNAAKGLVFSMKRNVLVFEENYRPLLLKLYELSGTRASVFSCLESTMLLVNSERKNLLKLATLSQTSFPDIMNLKGPDSLADLNEALEHYGLKAFLKILEFTTDSLEIEKGLRDEIECRKKQFMRKGCSEDEYFNLLAVIGDNLFPKIIGSLSRALPFFEDRVRENILIIVRYRKSIGEPACHYVPEDYRRRFSGFVARLAKIAGPRTGEILLGIDPYTALQKPTKALEEIGKHLK